jgi:hypothetical protein
MEKLIRQLAVLLVATTMAASNVHADDWPSVQTVAITSPNGEIVVRIVPGTDMSAVVGFAGAAKGEPARALFYRLKGDDKFVLYQQVKLLNPVAPVLSLVANSGELVTLDNWHNLGYGKILAHYGADGKVRRSYKLAQIYPAADIRKLSLSVSSIYWRCPSAPMLDRGATLLTLNDKLGKVIEFELATGKISRSRAHKGC